MMMMMIMMIMMMMMTKHTILSDTDELLQNRHMENAADPNK